jgi:hypothetical protein
MSGLKAVLQVGSEPTKHSYLLKFYQATSRDPMVGACRHGDLCSFVNKPPKRIGGFGLFMYVRRASDWC